jgi:hypothetical protein
MAQARRRRWRWWLGGFAVLLVAGAVFVNAQLEPHRLADTVLERAGAALQLRITYEGTPEYAFRPEPRLVLPNLSVAASDGQVAFLRATRAEISLPWSTITGGEPVVTRITLDAPIVRLPLLKRWLAGRPPAPFKLPTLSRGLSVRAGIVEDASWILHGLSVELPRLKQGEAAKLDASATFVAGKTAMPFQLSAIAATPGLASPLDLRLTLKPQGAPASIALLGRYEWADPKFMLAADKFALVAKSPIPSLEGKGKLELAEQATLEFDAVLSRWPESWPSLPKSLASTTDKLPVQLRYRGKRDFSDPLTLTASRDATELGATLRFTEIRDWLATGPASPLPPLQGTLKTPALEFDGVTLEGVEVEISNEGGSAGAAP